MFRKFRIIRNKVDFEPESAAKVPTHKVSDRQKVNNFKGLKGFVTHFFVTKINFSCNCLEFGQPDHQALMAC